MNHDLTRDEFEALEQIGQSKAYDKVSACIARNSKKLIGIKLIAHRNKGGGFTLTEKGEEIIFMKDCIKGLRTLAAGTSPPLAPAVATFLGRKGYAVAGETPGSLVITERGHECLADIDLSEKK